MAPRIRAYGTRCPRLYPVGLYRPEPSLHVGAARERPAEAAADLLAGARGRERDRAIARRQVRVGVGKRGARASDARMNASTTLASNWASAQRPSSRQAASCLRARR